MTLSHTCVTPDWKPVTMSDFMPVCPTLLMLPDPNHGATVPIVAVNKVEGHIFSVSQECSCLFACVEETTINLSDGPEPKSRSRLVKRFLLV